MPGQQQYTDLERRLKKLEQDPPLKEHQHNAFDSTRVEYSDLNRKIFYVSHTLFGTTAATAGNYGVFLIVPIACVVTKFQEVHQVAGSDASAVTLQLEKMTGTEAPGSGDNVLSTALSLKATANTVQTGVLTTTLANKSLKAGDRLGLKDAGTLTAVDTVTVLVELMVL